LEADEDLPFSPDAYMLAIGLMVAPWSGFNHAAEHGIIFEIEKQQRHLGTEIGLAMPYWWLENKGLITDPSISHETLVPVGEVEPIKQVLATLLRMKEAERPLVVVHRIGHHL
jgi:hypothetical protein